MANTLAPFGFRQTGSTGGSSPTFGLITRQIAYNNATKIFQNDPVKNLDTGYVAQWTAATAVSQLAGIFNGCSYLSVSQGKLVYMPYWPGSDVASGSVVTAYLQPCNLSVPSTFLVQVSGASPVAFADIGQNIDVALGTGSTLTGFSGATADFSTLGTTATLPFRVMGLYDGVGNGSDATSVNNWIMVAANVYGSTGI
jgi:hypothetical protein